GVPLVCEIGPRDLKAGQVAVYGRLDPSTRTAPQPVSGFTAGAAGMLADIQAAMMAQARAYPRAMSGDRIAPPDDLGPPFSGTSGFVRAKWSGDPASEELLKPLGVTIRCIPYEQTGIAGRCVLTGAPAITDAIFAKAY